MDLLDIEEITFFYKISTDELGVLPSDTILSTRSEIVKKSSDTFNSTEQRNTSSLFMI